ncbi:MAG: M48 family metallopeptidase, partial [Nitrososphaerales archaeon]
IRSLTLSFGIGILLVTTSSAWAGLEDQHDVPAIIKALELPIPSEVVAKAQQYDDRLMRGGDLEGRKVYLVTDDRLKRLNNLVHKILTAMREDDQAWVVRVLDTSPKTVGAFVTGGKYIYVFTGLLDQATSEDELAFVLSHEIGHSYLKHNLRRQVDITTTMANLADLVAAVAAKNSREKVGAVTEGVRAGYSRDDEEEADAIAVAISSRAGFDPLRGVDFFSRSVRKDNEADQQKTEAVDQSRQRIQAIINECNGRIQAINMLRSSGRDVPQQYQYETQMICNQAQQDTASYNVAVAKSNEEKNQQAVDAIYSAHPSHQHRIGAVAALTDYMAGRRSLASLKQFEQSYRVMVALKLANTSIMNRIESGR